MCYDVGVGKYPIMEGRYTMNPAIFVSFRQVDGLNFTGAYDMLTMVIADLYNKHLYLLDGIRQKVVPSIETKGFAAVSSSFFAALCSAFGRYDVVHIGYKIIFPESGK